MAHWQLRACAVAMVAFSAMTQAAGVALGEAGGSGPWPAAAATAPVAPAPAAPAPRNTPDETQPTQTFEAIDWATRENARADGPLRGRIDLTRIAVGGRSCGGAWARVSARWTVVQKNLAAPSPRRQ
jgi:hypothetical protein